MTSSFSSSQAVFVNFSPPSIDLLLESVAASFKGRAIAVILTGTGNDGTLGVQAIHKMGGKVMSKIKTRLTFSRCHLRRFKLEPLISSFQ